MTALRRRTRIMTLPSPPRAHPASRLSTGLDFRAWFLRWIGVSQLVLYALPLLLTLMDPIAPRGIMGYVQRDYSVPMLLWAIPFLVSLGAAVAAGLGHKTPRLALLVMLIGQACFTGVALHYALTTGEVSAIGLAPHLGSLLLSAGGIVAAAGHQQAQRHTRLASIYRVYLRTVLALTLMLYAGGLLLNPEGLVARGIQASWGSPILLILVAGMGLGAGGVLMHTASPGGLFVCLIAQWAYALFGLSFLGVPGMSITGIVSHVGFAITSFFVMVTWPKAPDTAV